MQATTTDTTTEVRECDCPVATPGSVDWGCTCEGWDETDQTWWDRVAN